MVDRKQLTWGNDAEVLKELYRHWEGVAPVEKMHGPGGTRFCGIVVDGLLVAATELVLLWDTLRTRTVGMVENVFVHPDHRRKGYGRMVMEYTLEVAAEPGMDCQQVKLTTHQDEGKELYRSMGMDEFAAFRRVNRE